MNNDDKRENDREDTLYQCVNLMTKTRRKGKTSPDGKHNREEQREVHGAVENGVKVVLEGQEQVVAERVAAELM